MKAEKVAYTLAENLKDLLTEKGITSKELCKLASEKGYDLNESLISDLLNVDVYNSKIRFCRYDKVLAIADTLNVSLDYLLGLSNTKSLNRDYKLIGAVTGLTDDAISILEHWTEQFARKNQGVVLVGTEVIPPEELSKIIKSKGFIYLVYHIRALDYINQDPDCDEYPKVLNPILSPQRVNNLVETLGKNNTRKYIEYLIQEDVKAIIKEISPFSNKWT